MGYLMDNNALHDYNEIKVRVFNSIKSRLVADILGMIVKNYIDKYPLDSWNRLLKDLRVDIEVAVDENLILMRREITELLK